MGLALSNKPFKSGCPGGGQRKPKTQSMSPGFADGGGHVGRNAERLPDHGQQGNRCPVLPPTRDSILLVTGMSLQRIPPTSIFQVRTQPRGHFDLALGNLEETTLPDYSRLQSTKRSRYVWAVLSGHVRGNFLCSHETTNTDNNLRTSRVGEGIFKSHIL